MKITKMTEADIPFILELERAVFTCPWDESGFSVSAGGHYHYFVAKEGLEVIGYIVYFQVLDEGEIHRIAVKPEWRRQGIAKSLMAEIIIFSKALSATVIHLEVRESNEKALNLYKSIGFVEDGRRKGYYQKPVEDSVLLSIPVT